MPTAKQKNSAPAPSCPATSRTEAMEGEGGDYLISLRKEGSHRSHSIVRVALIAPGVRCKSWYCGLTHFRQSSFPPHVDPPFPRRSQNVLAPRLLRINAFPKRPDRPPPPEYDPPVMLRNTIVHLGARKKPAPPFFHRAPPRTPKPGRSVAFSTGKPGAGAWLRPTSLTR
jgi:hypothetical protein